MTSNGSEYVLAIDGGTSGVKVGLVSLTGAVAATAHREYGVTHPRPGWVEQSVPELWDAEADAIREVMSTMGPSDTVLGTAVSSQRATMVPIGPSGEAAAPYIGWQDQRGVPYLAELAAAIGPSSYRERSGMLLEPTASMSKIMWILREDPALASRTTCYGSHQTLMLRQLGVDENVCDPADASYMGLLDVTSLRWSAELLAAAGVEPSHLPRLVDSGVVAGAVSRAAAEATGLPYDRPIVVGGGDLQVGAVGVGAVEPGAITVGVGTGGHSVGYAETPVTAGTSRLNCLAHAVPGGWEVEGIAFAPGASFRWLRDQLGGAPLDTDGDPYDGMTALAATAPAGCDGLLALPALSGAGAPEWDPAFGGTLLGLRLHHERGHVIRAFMEGVCFEQRAIQESMRASGIGIEEMRIWGGITKSELWCQMQADVYGVPAIRTEVADAGLIGAAILAAVGVGAFPDVPSAAASMVRVQRVFEPDPARAEVYSESYARFRDAVATLTPFYSA